MRGYLIALVLFHTCVHGDKVVAGVGIGVETLPASENFQWYGAQMAIPEPGKVAGLFSLASGSNDFTITFVTTSPLYSDSPFTGQHVLIHFANGSVSAQFVDGSQLSPGSWKEAPLPTPMEPGIYWVSMLDNVVQVGTGSTPALNLLLSTGLGPPNYPITHVGLRNNDPFNVVILNYFIVNPLLELGPTTVEPLTTVWPGFTVATPGRATVVFELESGMHGFVNSATHFHVLFSQDQLISCELQFDNGQLSVFDKRGICVKTILFPFPPGIYWITFNNSLVKTGTGAIPGENTWLTTTISNEPFLFNTIALRSRQHDWPVILNYFKLNYQPKLEIGHTELNLPSVFYYYDLYVQTPGEVDIVFELAQGGSNLAFGFASNAPTPFYWPSSELNYCMVQYYQGNIFLRYNDGYEIAMQCYADFSPGVYWISFKGYQLNVGAGSIPGQSISCSAYMPYSLAFTQISLNNGDWSVPAILNYVKILPPSPPLLPPSSNSDCRDNVFSEGRVLGPTALYNGDSVDVATSNSLAVSFDINDGRGSITFRVFNGTVCPIDQSESFVAATVMLQSESFWIFIGDRSCIKYVSSQQLWVALLVFPNQRIELATGQDGWGGDFDVYPIYLDDDDTSNLISAHIESNSDNLLSMQWVQVPAQCVTDSWSCLSAGVQTSRVSDVKPQISTSILSVTIIAVIIVIFALFFVSRKRRQLQQIPTQIEGKPDENEGEPSQIGGEPSQIGEPIEIGELSQNSEIGEPIEGQVRG